MSDRKIILKNHGAYLQIKKWIPAVRNEHGKKIVDGYDDIKETQITSLYPYLGVEVETGENFTFGDFWELLYPDFDEYNIIFAESTGGHDLHEFHQDFLCISPEKEDNPESKIVYLVIRMNYEYDISYQADEMYLSRYTDFSGFGSCEGKDTYWAIEFTSLSVLKQCPLIIENKVNIIKIYGNKTNGYKSENLLSENTKERITVYDVISGILDEITFCGTPEKRDSAKEGLISSMENAKEQIEQMKTLDQISKALDDIMKKDSE